MPVGREVEIRQVCPDCGRVDPGGVWRGEVESLEMGYIGPPADMPVFERHTADRVDVHVPCPECLARR